MKKKKKGLTSLLAPLVTSTEKNVKETERKKKEKREIKKKYQGSHSPNMLFYGLKNDCLRVSRLQNIAHMSKEKRKKG